METKKGENIICPFGPTSTSMVAAIAVRLRAKQKMTRATVKKTPILEFADVFMTIGVVSGLPGG